MSTIPGVRFPWQLSTTAADVVVVDVEGNGAHPPEIIEIALLPMTSATDTTWTDLRSWLVRPNQPINPIVTRKVHGISNADVADAPRWPAVAGEVRAALTDRIVVAHNASVERAVLATHLRGWRPQLVLDTLRLAKLVWPDLPGGYSLDRLIAHTKVAEPTPDDLALLDFRSIGAGQGDNVASTRMRRHRASYDAWMTGAMFARLLADAQLDGVGVLAAARLPDPTSTSALTNTDTGTDQQEGLW